MESAGRARWTPVVRWGSIDMAGGVGSVRCQGEDIHGGSGMILFPACQTRGPIVLITLRFSGSMSCETSASELVGASSDPLEFGRCCRPKAPS